MNFILKMAWRDTRASRRRLLLFSLAIVLGVAALVGVGSVRDNLRAAVAEQTKALLGADLVITARAAFPPEAEALLAGLGGEQAREITFNSMLSVSGPEGGARLVQVRALAGAFPFYGEFALQPAEARRTLETGAHALVEATLLAQYGLAPGATIRLGAATFTVTGGLRSVPGENAVFATLVPRVFIPLATVGATALLQPGSLARHRVYFKFAPGTDVGALVARLRERLRELRLSFETVESRRRELGRAIDGVNSFLMLVGFASLFLGAIGVASAIHAHVSRKLPTVAVLRCLGASARTAFAIYLVQGVGLGLCGALLGALLGGAAQLALPLLLRDFLPFAFTFSVSWPAVAQGVGAGLVISVLAALFPLLAVRRVSPLRAIRSGYAEGAEGGPDPWRWVLGAVLVGLVFAFALWQTSRVRWGLGFGAAMVAGFLVLAGLARLLVAATRRLRLRGLPFAWRQGVANLHRPNNRTVLLLVSLGLGTFLLMTLHLARTGVLGQLQRIGGDDRPNLTLFDIQDDQVRPLQELLRAEGAPVLQEAAIVTMRLAAIKGRPVAELLADRRERGAGWTLRREYRSTFRARLTDTERIVAGTFTGRVAPGTEPAPVSVERDIARDLGVGLGDELTWDVQGVPVRTIVGSLREVEWQRMAPNFFVVFPEGVLEAAPKFHVMALRVRDAAESARVQRAVTRAQPNVSVLDLGVILDALDRVFTRASSVVQFLALFTVVTGVLVLAGAVLIGRGQRLRESVLLRTLGATRRQVRRILLAEYLALGSLGAAVGVGLAVAANWALARFVFEQTWVAPSPLVLVVGWVAVCALTVGTGLLASRGICDHPPLEVLREET